MDRNKKQILLVADESLVGSLAKPLSDWNYRLITASEAEQVLKLVVTEQVDLILYDLELAGTDFASLKRIRRQASQIPLLILTPAWSMETAAQTIDLGIENYILKPFNLEMLRFHIDRALEMCLLDIENRRLRKSLDLWNHLYGKMGYVNSATLPPSSSQPPRPDHENEAQPSSVPVQPLKKALEDPERKIILHALKTFNFNRQETARALRINRTTLYNKMKKLGLLHRANGSKFDFGD